MRIDHIALYTNNLEGMKSFYEKYFHAESNNMYYNSKTGLKTYFLSFDDNTRLEIMTKPNISTEIIGLQLGYVHIAFSVGSKEMVDDLTRRLKNDGYKILSEPRTTGDGYYESCVEDPDGNQIEITI